MNALAVVVFLLAASATVESQAVQEKKEYECLYKRFTDLFYFPEIRFIPEMKSCLAKNNFELKDLEAHVDMMQVKVDRILAEWNLIKNGDENDYPRIKALAGAVKSIRDETEDIYKQGKKRGDTGLGHCLKVPAKRVKHRIDDALKCVH